MNEMSYCCNCGTPKAEYHFSSRDESYCSLCYSLMGTEAWNDRDREECDSVAPLSDAEFKRLKEDLLKHHCHECGSSLRIIADFLCTGVNLLYLGCDECNEGSIALLDDNFVLVETYDNFMWQGFLIDDIGEIPF